MARGYEGAFGRMVNAPYVWLPLCAIFLLGLLRLAAPVPARAPRPAGAGRGLRGLPLLLQPRARSGSRSRSPTRRSSTCSAARSGSASAAADRGCRLASVRCRSSGSRSPPSSCSASASALNVADSNVIDVGYAGVIGADRIADGEPLYGDFPEDNQPGDTYGPVAYYAYVPFEQAAPVDGELGRPAGRPRRRDLLRPGDRGAPLLARTQRLRRGDREAAASASCSPSPGQHAHTRHSRWSRTQTTPLSRSCW